MKTEVIQHTPETPLILGETERIIERNKKILELLANDKRPQEIAKELYVGVWTVRGSIQRMIENNGYHSVAALVAAALRKNLIY
jgi:DNA-binding CsgD family transcriptional regulator